MIQDDFDRTDTSNTGRPIYWRLDKYIEVIEAFIRADEIQIALQMCDTVPAWYRDNPPPELQRIKETLDRQLYSVFDYSGDPDEAACERSFGEAQWSNGYMYPRAEIIAQDMIALETKGVVPWIYDCGASHGNLPLGLIKAGFKFNYLGHSMNQRIQEKVKGWVGELWRERPEPGQHTIFWCTEVIEHAMRPEDIPQAAYKTGVSFDRIYLSVPYGCLGGGLPDWNTRPLGHVRGWGRQEFIEFAARHWPGYQWTFYMAHSMVLRGVK